MESRNFDVGAALRAFGWPVGMAATCLLAGCSGSDDAGKSGDTSGCSAAGDASDGSGTVDGSVKGSPYSSVAAARVIGAPDSKSTTVVYVFSQPVACSELCSPGWDARIADQTQSLEIKIFGTSPGTFTVVKTATPAPGEASVNYTLSSTTSTPQELSASGGQVSLERLEAPGTAKGSFDLSFGADALKGTFDAAYCPGGHEP